MWLRDEVKDATIIRCRMNIDEEFVMNESWSRMVQVIEQSLERERTWTYINIIEQFFRTWTWTYININIRSEAALRPVWRWEVYFFAVQCRISSATKTSVNGSTRLNFRSDNLANVARSYGSLVCLFQKVTTSLFRELGLNLVILGVKD